MYLYTGNNVDVPKYGIYSPASMPTDADSQQKGR